MATATNDDVLGERAVVLGSSMAGLCAATVLSGHFAEVLVLDRDELPYAATPRTRVPQDRHPHLLLRAGAQALEEWYPGLLAELVDAGAVEIDLCADFLWHQDDGVQRRPASSLRGPSMSRPLLELVLRERVRRRGNVAIQPRTTVTGLSTTPEGAEVTGVVLDDRSEIAADLVIDCSGRQARSLRWLENVGYQLPSVSVVEVDTTYVSRRFRRIRGDSRDWKAAAVVGTPDSRRVAMATPIEEDQWIVVIAGLNGEAAPTDDVGMLAYARTFDSSVIASIIQECEPTGPVVTHHFPTNQRRYVEKLRAFPLNWLLLGDSVCSFDPIYGQGMTSAALQAQALGSCLARASTLDRAFSRAYFKAAGRIVGAPWSIAVGGDFVYQGTRGKKPFGTDLLNRYTGQVILAGQCDDAVVIRFNEVVSLVRAPGSLLSPPFVVRVLRSARRVRRERRRERRRVASSKASIDHPIRRRRSRSAAGRR